MADVVSGITSPADATLGDPQLDNATWTSLTGPHRRFAQRLGTAARYLPDVSPFLALVDHRDQQCWSDAAELVAFVRTVDLKHARWMFHWAGAGVREMDRLLKHLSADANVERMVQENHDRTTRADGLAMLKAMRDGGWRQGSVPPGLRMALLDMRDAGLSQPKIAEMTGLTHDQVRVMANGMRLPRPVLGLGAHFAA